MISLRRVTSFGLWWSLCLGQKCYFYIEGKVFFLLFSFSNSNFRHPNPKTKLHLIRIISAKLQTSIRTWFRAQKPVSRWSYWSSLMKSALFSLLTVMYSADRLADCSQMSVFTRVYPANELEVSAGFLDACLF